MANNAAAPDVDALEDALIVSPPSAAYRRRSSSRASAPSAPPPYNHHPPQQQLHNLPPSPPSSELDDADFSDDQNSLSSDDELDEDDDDEPQLDEDDEEDDADDADRRLVRQNSSFARLSADSWLTVVSEYERDGPNENLLFSQVEEEPSTDPVEEAAASQMHAVSALEGRSVLDCVVDLLRGTRAQKRKMLRRYGERWIWLGEDLMSLNWKSKKRGVDNGRLNLTRVKKLRSADRELIIESNDGKKLALMLATRTESVTWLTGLSCLVPKKAKVSESNRILKERIKYDPLKDSWRGKAVSTRKRVNEYIMLGGIGRGSFGKVKLALSTEDKRFYAVKVVSNVKKSGAASIGNREEQAVLRKLDHPNIVTHRDILLDSENDGYVVVVEYMARGVVMDSSKLEGVKPLSEDGVREIMRDVVSGLEYLHHQRIAHRDIKPDNLLRAGDGTVKVSDFGEARMYDVSSEDPRAKSPAPGTPAFIAPELCMSERSPKAPPESYAADIWSLGASLFYMVYGRAPFLAKNVFEIYDCICTQRLRFPDQPKVSRKLKDLIKKMLVKEPKNRATLQDVARHAWFNERVVQKEELKKIRITQADIDSAIGLANWSVSHGRDDND
ncbi:unnamed protein product [Agarophyton chilense]|eukprot:gb/GEZJ01002021.1/.p1 GENE.gb/GEZJ01002021.1/~~gb/GEZJ01002021.1/.p1  ORF type:complete len:687 (+),score=134.59 gb/GEZJ01002021.1/:222-2063(+)